MGFVHGRRGWLCAVAATMGWMVGSARSVPAGEVIRLPAKETLTAVEIYEVAFSEATPIPSGSEWEVLIRHGQGETPTRVRPEASRVLGTFAFDEGTDGYVQIQAGGSQGLVVADAVEWGPAGPPAATD